MSSLVLFVAMAQTASPFCALTHTQGIQARHRRPFFYTSRIHLKYGCLELIFGV